MKIILNALIAKKKSGGGFQIALNFITQTLMDNKFNIDWYYILSQDLYDVLIIKHSHELHNNFYIFPSHPTIKLYFKSVNEIRLIETLINPDLVYSILAPYYFKFKTIEVMRCANAWDTNLNIYAYKSLNFKNKIIFGIRSILIWRLMKRSKYFVTQSDSVKNGIMKAVNALDENVKVVPNVLPLIYKNCNIERYKINHTFNIVYVAAPFAHKKVDLVPFIAKKLRSKYKLSNFKFYVTIPFEHPFCFKFSNIVNKLGVEDFVENVGYKKQDELIELYNNSHIGFFPSLLETFSATLLEYMHFQLPIVASDFNFNTEISKDAALYFEPNNIEEAAEKIYLLMTDINLYNNFVEKSKDVLVEYSDYNKHFSQTVDFLLYVINKESK